MENSILPILNTLQSQGYNSHIYGCPSSGWYHQGKPLLDATHELPLFIYDEADLRVHLFKVTSRCGTVKGVAII